LRKVCFELPLEIMAVTDNRTCASGNTMLHGAIEPALGRRSQELETCPLAVVVVINPTACLLRHRRAAL
jgi:hypothetical protein